MSDSEVRSRPRDAGATRQAILGAARTLFAQHGYAGTTVKRVADAAGVSPNLITRYFGGKDGLLFASAQPTIGVDEVHTGDLAGFGARLAASIVRRWSGQSDEDPMLVLHRASSERPEAAATLSAFLDEHSMAPLVDYLRSCGVDDPEGRAAAIDALVIGLSTRRRVLRSDLGDAKVLEGWLGPAIQRLAAGA